ncbi:MAG: hypothetical protein MUD08_07685 [Cytophagales bacterium]|jgi:hypothetical protein|nr:hypothetical protein [Cytophagales bacterium]
MKISVHIIALLICGFAHAQVTISQPLFDPKERIPTDTGVARRGFELYFVQQFGFSNAAGINSRLRETNYPELGGMQVFWGGGLQYRFNRLLLGGELSHTVNPYGPRTNDVAVTRRGAYILQLNVAYSVYQKGAFRIYPFAGVSGMETTLTLTRTTPDADFNGLLQQPGNAVSLTHFQAAVNFGVGLDVTSDEVGQSPLVNFRLGYRASGPSDWFSDYTVIRNAPLDRLGMVYVQFGLGYNWNRLSKQQRLLGR